jgi:hypothetical protein
VSPDDLVKKRSILAAITSDALADNAPLWKIVEKEVNHAFLEAIAAEHEKGRILLIGTTDLDALAYIPASFAVSHREEFDTEYMRALYQTGHEMAAKGYPWEKVPPGF